MDVDGAREELEREQRFIEARGGREWIDAFIKPFYMTMQGLGRYSEEAETLIPLLHARAFELNLEDIAAMLSMQWRLQASGAWFAVARADASLSKAVHDGFESCFGSLTEPSLTVAALTYPNGTTADALSRYRERAIANNYGSTDIVDAALRRLDPASVGEVRTSADDWLDELLARAARAQSG